MDFYFAEVMIRNIEPEDFKKIEPIVSNWYRQPPIVDLSPSKKHSEAAFSGWLSVSSVEGPRREHQRLEQRIKEVLPDARVFTNWLNWDYVQWDESFGDDDDENEGAG